MSYNKKLATAINKKIQTADYDTFYFESEATFLQKKKLTPYGFYQFRIQIIFKDGKIKTRFQ